MDPDERDAVWLVLAYHLPQGAGALRVKIWRRVQQLGAIAIKNSMYVLPCNEQSREDFQWTLAELKSGGGEGLILESRFIAGATDEQIRASFKAARTADYEELAAEIRAYYAPGGGVDDRALSRMRRRLAQISAIDFFGASGRDAANDALHRLMESTTGDVAMPDDVLKPLTQRTWVTRRNVQVDRIASAWLIRRWVDPDAKFKFVADKSYLPGEREIRFDMFEGEFTHEGDLCTFEVLARHARPDDDALRYIAEIVHDIDLKDGKFGHAETGGVAMLLSGIAARFDSDHTRVERGGELFDDIYRSLGERENVGRR